MAGVLVIFIDDPQYLQDARLARFADREAVIFDPSSNVAFASYPDVVTSLPGLTNFLVTSTKPTTEISLFAPESVRTAYASLWDGLLAAVKDAQNIVQVRRNTLVHRSAPMVEQSIRNLPQLKRFPIASTYGSFLHDTPVFLVAAGPSLDRNGHLLKLCAERGLVFTVNTALPAVGYHGIRADMTAMLEPLAVADTVKNNLKHTRFVTAAISAHEDIFRLDVPSAVFLPATPGFIQVAEYFGGQALGYGGSVATAAAALAAAWGSKTIVLVGQDLAYTDTRIYATGTGRENDYVTVDGDKLYRSDIAAQNAKFEAAGIALRENAWPVEYVPAWGGSGEVLSAPDFTMFRRWLEGWVERGTGTFRVINATEGGARIAGTEELPLREVLDTLPMPARKPEFTALPPAATEETFTKFVTDMKHTAWRIKLQCEKILMAKASRQKYEESRLQALLRNCKLIEALAMPKLEACQDGNLSGKAYTRAMLKALTESAAEVMERL